jgi:hypothetical protein
MMFTRQSILSAALALAVAGLANYDTRLNDRKTAYLGTDGSIISRSSASTLADANSYWDGDGVTGAPSIVIDLSDQQASFYKGPKLVGVSAISSGREGFGTPTGRYKITQKNKDHVSNLYGDYVNSAGTVVKANIGVKTHRRPAGTSFRGAPMPYFMRIHGGIGMHAGYLPGYPASHGCIRLPKGAAKRFFENAPLGTPVNVVH